MSDKIQEELDIAEEYFLKKVFKDINNPVISSNIQMFCRFKNIDTTSMINEYLKKFEDLSRAFMNEEGLYDGIKLTNALSIKYPAFTGLEIPNIRPLDLFTIIDSLIGFESLGYIIQNL